MFSLPVLMPPKTVNLTHHDVPMSRGNAEFHSDCNQCAVLGKLVNYILSFLSLLLHSPPLPFETSFQPCQKFNHTQSTLKAGGNMGPFKWQVSQHLSPQKLLLTKAPTGNLYERHPQQQAPHRNHRPQCSRSPSQEIPRRPSLQLCCRRRWREGDDGCQSPCFSPVEGASKPPLRKGDQSLRDQNR